MDLMYVMFAAYDEEFTHFCNEHWKPFQAAIREHCSCDWCGAAHQPPVFSPAPAGPGPRSSPIPSLESCPPLSDGEEDIEESSVESDDSYWSVLSAVEQVTTGSNALEVGGVEVARQVWVDLGSGRVEPGGEGDE